ncbi:MAG TPA: hypothetical protein VLX67_03985 [Stellaceae bacterium]|nr:hypothetical protein [Stellaceae bacterium]
MTYGQIAVLALIIGVFTTLGAVLAWASWYSQSPKHERARHKHGKYPAGGGLITDDD